MCMNKSAFNENMIDAKIVSKCYLRIFRIELQSETNITVEHCFFFTKTSSGYECQGIS